MLLLVHIDVRNAKRYGFCGDTYGVDGNDLTGSLLHLSELTNEVPETGLGDRLVDGEDPHAVELGRGLLLGGKVASNHHVLSEASHLEDC